MDKLLICLLAFVLIIGTVCGSFYLLNEKNFDEMIEYIDSFKADPLDSEANSPVPAKDENGNWYFETDEDFKILHLTDIHLSGGVLNKETDKLTVKAVVAMVTAENPDLVVVTGDIAYAIGLGGTINNKYAHDMFIRLMENLGVYWTVTLGNHDTEPYNYHKRDAVADMYADESLEYCLFEHSPENVSGEGNHIINVKNTSGEILQSLFMIDSHSYIRQGLVGGLIDSLAWNYDYIKQDQIDWYESMINTYNPQSSMMFFHIPLAEVKEGYDEYVANGRQVGGNVTWFSGNDGEKGDVVFPSKHGDELFETVERLGNTSYFFCGHDHYNNFVLGYKGVMFSYGYSVDYIAYGGIGEKGYQRGCTVIEIDSIPGFVTVTHENYYQEKYGSLEEKESMNMDKDAYKGE